MSRKILVLPYSKKIFFFGKKCIDTSINNIKKFKKIVNKT